MEKKIRTTYGTLNEKRSTLQLLNDIYKRHKRINQEKNSDTKVLLIKKQKRDVEIYRALLFNINVEKLP